MERKIAETTIEIFEMVKDIEDETTMLAMMGTVIDKWAHKHGMDVDKADELYEDFSRVARVKHSLTGLV